jgi:hypothetical protein
MNPRRDVGDPKGERPIQGILVFVGFCLVLSALSPDRVLPAGVLASADGHRLAAAASQNRTRGLGDFRSLPHSLDDRSVREA